jgi:hypothetical protein
MTRHLPAEQLARSAVSIVAADSPEAIAARYFHSAPRGYMHAALAALYRLKPELGVEPDHDLHAWHMLLWPVDDQYFLRLCGLLKAFGVGAHHGER